MSALHKCWYPTLRLWVPSGNDPRRLIHRAGAVWGIGVAAAAAAAGRGRFLGKVFALRAHCVCTACALRAHCVHIAAKPTPCHLCITLQSNKANRTHIEPLPTRYVDVPVNISFSVVEYHYAVTLVSAIVITYFIIKELSVHS